MLALRSTDAPACPLELLRRSYTAETWLSPTVDEPTIICPATVCAHLDYYGMVVSAPHALDPARQPYVGSFPSPRVSPESCVLALVNRIPGLWNHQDDRSLRLLCALDLRVSDRSVADELVLHAVNPATVTALTAHVMAHATKLVCVGTQDVRVDTPRSMALRACMQRIMHVLNDKAQEQAARSLYPDQPQGPSAPLGPFISPTGTVFRSDGLMHRQEGGAMRVWRREGEAVTAEVLPPWASHRAYKVLAGGLMACGVIPVGTRSTYDVEWTSGKFRAERMTVVLIVQVDPYQGLVPALTRGTSFYDLNFIYATGCTMVEPSFDDNLETCGSGLHYFLSLSEAAHCYLSHTVPEAAQREIADAFDRELASDRFASQPAVVTQTLLRRAAEPASNDDHDENDDDSDDESDGENENDGEDENDDDSEDENDNENDAVAAAAVAAASPQTRLDLERPTPSSLVQPQAGLPSVGANRDGPSAASGAVDRPVAPDAQLLARLRAQQAQLRAHAALATLDEVERLCGRTAPDARRCISALLMGMHRRDKNATWTEAEAGALLDTLGTASCCLRAHMEELLALRFGTATATAMSSTWTSLLH